jgi:DNA mismatch repair ATPase MutL
MTAPHCTSKISSFEDLVTEKLQSYGFRGEALNALCSISDLEITTKTSKDLTGTFATFDKSGNPVKELSLATNVGTTIR